MALQKMARAHACYGEFGLPWHLQVPSTDARHHPCIWLARQFTLVKVCGGSSALPANDEPDGAAVRVLTGLVFCSRQSVAYRSVFASRVLFYLRCWNMALTASSY
jgi:hypothetical protein